ncbi:tetratricopeptide repeat protein SKI3 isoform X1 [Arachis duranensis]|uniref:Tetratricopeptide repeat protein SKI3 isoform X1 n=1 Tax=Arachis duranensis TaxID=130453 RepID=A0A6P4BW72_ARADU|nr:tetratricopeptide repeat protein SKI3 isoform X1 [Arachis duranensis]XP_052108675.1 tetratricopeptide repeat protein SKI3 isoform X1 [Arachis duranensis]
MESQTHNEEQGVEHLFRRLQDFPDDASLHFDIGLFLWEKGGEANGSTEKAAEHFIESAKLNPKNGEPFKYLGHYYGRISIDTQRALKCYQRAVALNPDDSDSGEALCNLLYQGGKDSLEAAVCREASEKSPRAFWAFRRLGFLQVHQKKWSEAVQNLQHAIRGYPTCAELWEALGLAYQRLGRYTAAIKSYGRAIELDDKMVFALVESGNISLTLGSFRKGVEQFRQALEISSQCVPAQYGLALGLLCLAKDCMNLGAFKWGASLLEEASEVARASAYSVRNVSCIWKLYADVQLAYARCYPWIEEVQELEANKEAFSASIISWRRTCLSAARLARFSYQRALHLCPWQANIYADIAVTSDLITSLDKDYERDLDACRQLPEKMCVGALLLEGDNYEFWVTLGCLSDQNALNQHALIRGLQLNVSLAVAWGYLGKLYSKMSKKKLARQMFDRARSIDPSLALPWASMSADCCVRESAPDEAFESCSQAVQMMPLAEFQIGLTKLAMLSGHLSSTQVFGAIQQAVQRSPHYPESHNLHGLVCESRKDYRSAAISYRIALHAISIALLDNQNSQIKDVSINLARSLCKAGNAVDAIQECENLRKEGMLDFEVFQVYAISLWQLGKNDLALSIVRSLAASVSSMEKTAMEISVSFIFRLLYYISGLDAVITNIMKMPKELIQSSKVNFVMSAIDALDGHNRLGFLVSRNLYFLNDHDEIDRVHFLIALGKLVKNGHDGFLAVQSGIAYLKRILHMFPNCSLIRNLVGYLSLSGKESNSCHLATRCCKLDHLDLSDKEGLKSASDIHGAAVVACYANGNSNPKSTFQTCTNQCSRGPAAIRYLQRYFHQKPWNHDARYLLILTYFQRAREERFPHQLCVILNRLICVALSNEFCGKKEMCYEYRQFQLLLCASEISLQCGNHITSISHAQKASVLVLPDNYLFFAHLLLCRVYAIKGDLLNCKKEYIRCLELRTDCHIGWMSLKLMECHYQLQIDSNVIDSNFEECLKKGANSWNMWIAVYNLVRGLISFHQKDLISAEELMREACSMAGFESCLFLCHGAICMELARQYGGSMLLSWAVDSLNRFHELLPISLPLASLLVAQAEGSLGAKDKWDRSIRLEWYSWPSVMRPAELYFQMHLVVRQLKDGPNVTGRLESSHSAWRWVIRAIHMNPSCMRYWKVLQKLMQ